MARPTLGYVLIAAMLLLPISQAEAICGRKECAGGPPPPPPPTTEPRWPDPAPSINPAAQAARAAFNAGLAASRDGRYADAEGHYRQALSYDRTDSHAWLNLGKNIQRQNDPNRFQEAINAYEEAGRHGHAEGYESARTLRAWLDQQQRQRADAAARDAAQAAAKAAAQAEEAARLAAQRKAVETKVPSILDSLADDFSRETGAAPPTGGLMDQPPQFAGRMPSGSPSTVSPSPPTPPSVTTAKVDAGTDKLPTVNPADIKGTSPQTGLKIKPPPEPKPIFNPTPRTFEPRPEDIRRLGERAGTIVLDAIEKGGPSLDKSRTVLEDLLKMAPSDPDLRDASSYVAGLAMGRSRTEVPTRSLTTNDLTRMNTAKPGLDSVKPSLLAPTLTEMTNLKRWEDARNFTVIQALKRNDDNVSAAMAELEGMARRSPEDAVLRGALRLVQGMENYAQPREARR